jgi:hypothetical protein
MSAGLAKARCLMHRAREAAALCMQCRQPHCRECVTEHEGRLLCARCLRLSSGSGPSARPWALGRLPLEALGLAAGLALSWAVFFWMGKALLAVPSQFHEGSFWQGVMRSLDD